MKFAKQFFDGFDYVAFRLTCSIAKVAVVVYVVKELLRVILS